MGDHSAFFYGTLMAPQVLHRVCHGTPTPTPFQISLLTIAPALLHSFCRHKVRHRDYPAIIPSPTATVRGTFVQGLTDADLWRLDIFEGDEYSREKVKVKLLEKVGEEQGKGNVEGVEVEAETYVWVAGEGKLEEGEWDFEVFRREKMGRWVGVADEYSEVDEAVRATGGDPTGGRGWNGNITGELEGRKELEVIESAV
ncbi:hypothetical protein MMC08_002230 [Hypocenomyce scalaris]|nr:hypothetical protein [Hypocenomyce scalaris]